MITSHRSQSVGLLLTSALAVCAIGAPASAGTMKPTTTPQSSVASAKSFYPCAKQPSAAAPTISNRGAQLGSGTTEELSAQLHRQIDSGLQRVGRAPLPTRTVALRYLDSGSVVALDRHGRFLQRPSDAETAALTYSTKDEIKKTVAACLGVGAVGGTGWKAIGEDIIRQLTNWKTAAKFVIRRVGVAAAVSCMGGIVWRYI